MILLHELTKILFVNSLFLHFSFFISKSKKILVCFSINFLKKSKRFSTTDIGNLIFKIPNAKHDEQHLRGSVCVNLTVFVKSSLLQVVHHRLFFEGSQNVGA
ncbi:hypothetical protein HanIR_Chr04g0158641 [Helianthus annuus]|nr:hypothetical protein HanIR_Chr04g0158641 [Helianthus annuus]